MKRTVINNIEEFRDWMGKCKPVFAFDSETTSLNYLDLEIIGFSIADGKQACYVPLTYDNTKDMLDVLEFYICEAKLIIMHNAPFDMGVLNKYGIEIGG